MSKFPLFRFKADGLPCHGSFQLNTGDSVLVRDFKGEEIFLWRDTSLYGHLPDYLIMKENLESTISDSEKRLKECQKAYIETVVRCDEQLEELKKRRRKNIEDAIVDSCVIAAFTLVIRQTCDEKTAEEYMNMVKAIRDQKKNLVK